MQSHCKKPLSHHCHKSDNENASQTLSNSDPSCTKIAVPTSFSRVQIRHKIDRILLSHEVKLCAFLTILQPVTNYDVSNFKNRTNLFSDGTTPYLWAGTFHVDAYGKMTFCEKAFAFMDNSSSFNDQSS
jgi:hypothetical protein